MAPLLSVNFTWEQASGVARDFDRGFGEDDHSVKLFRQDSLSKVPNPFYFYLVSFQAVHDMERLSPLRLSVDFEQLWFPIVGLGHAQSPCFKKFQ